VKSEAFEQELDIFFEGGAELRSVHRETFGDMHAHKLTGAGVDAQVVASMRDKWFALVTRGEAVFAYSVPKLRPTVYAALLS